MRLRKFFIVIATFISLPIICYFFADNFEQVYGISLIVFFIFSSFLLLNRFVFFEPLTLFNFYNILGVIGFIYYYLEGFYRSKYISDTQYSNDLDDLFTKSIYYYLIGYCMTLVGYFIVRKKFDINIHVKIESEKVYKLLIYTFLILCYLNFLYIVMKFAGGNIFVYFQNIAIRQYEFTLGGGSTIFYNLGYIAIYLWQFLDKKQKSSRWLFLINLLAIFAIKYSTGRIVQTLFFLISVIALEYFLRYDFYKKYTRKIMFSFTIFGTFAFLMYFYRMYSSVVFINQANTDFVGFVTEKFEYTEFTQSLIEKGNIPNIPILMKIIDSWENEMGFLYGKSLIQWIFNFIPFSKSGLLPPSEIIKEVWYPHIEGGALPPTGYGEMYANFGIWGIVIGMFLFGIIMASTYNLLRKYNNMWYLLIYVNLSVFFFSVYPKGEFDNMSLYLFLPYIFTYICIRIFNQLFSRNIKAT